MLRVRNVLVLCSLIGAAALPAAAQVPISSGIDVAPTMKDVLTGSRFPVSMKLKDLSPAWRTFSVGGQLELGSWTRMVGAVLGATGAYYTQGDQVTLGSETYLVAYHAAGPTFDLAVIAQLGSGKVPAPEKMTPETGLLLTLLNVRTMGSIQDIRPFDIAREIAEGNVPSVIQGSIEKAHETALNVSSLSNLKQLATAMLILLQDYDEKYPTMSTSAVLKKSLLPYTKSEEVFLEPRTKQPYLPNPWLSGKSAAAITAPAEMVLFYEANPAPDGTRGAAFADGHAKRILESDWARVKKASHIP